MGIGDLINFVLVFSSIRSIGLLLIASLVCRYHCWLRIEHLSLAQHDTFLDLPAGLSQLLASLSMAAGLLPATLLTLHLDCGFTNFSDDCCKQSQTTFLSHKWYSSSYSVIFLHKTLLLEPITRRALYKRLEGLDIRPLEWLGEETLHPSSLPAQLWPVFVLW